MYAIMTVILLAMMAVVANITKYFLTCGNDRDTGSSGGEGGNSGEYN